MSLTDPFSTDTTSLMASFSTIIAILLIALTLLMIGLVIVIMLYYKQKKSATKKSDTTPFREYTNRLDETLRANQREPSSTDTVISNTTTGTTPSMSAPTPSTPANVVPQSKFSPKAKEAFYEDMGSTGDFPVVQKEAVLSRADDYNAKSKYVFQKQGASA